MGKRRILLWGFRPPRELVGSALGTLEQQVIDIVWRKGSASVREVQAELGDHAVAYTTVMTTLDRMYRKGLVTRTKSARMFVYAASRSRNELETAIATDIITDLLSGTEGAPPAVLLSHLVDAVGDRDRALLDELERLVKAKRQRQDTEETR